MARRYCSSASAGAERVSSQKLADALHVGAAQIRRDLALFGQFGRPGIGYRVTPLIHQLRLVLGTHRPWNVIVVGAGQLGRALLRYGVFPKRGFKLFERINKVKLLAKPFEKGVEMTHTLKLKRNVIYDEYDKDIKELFKERR